MTARISKITPKTPGERFVLIEKTMEEMQDKLDTMDISIKSEIGDLKKTINGIGARFDETRKTMWNRILSYVLPVLSRVTIDVLIVLLALTYGKKLIE